MNEDRFYIEDLKKIRAFCLNSDKEDIYKYIYSLQQELTDYKEENKKLKVNQERELIIAIELEKMQKELEDYKERNEKAIERLEALIVFWKKYNPIDNTMQVEQFKGVIEILDKKDKE